VQEYRRSASVLLGLWLLAALAATGCNKDPRSELAKATDKARRLYDRACSHLKDPAYTIEGKGAPLAVYRQDLNRKAESILKLDANDPQQKAQRDKELGEFPMKVASAGTISPEADKALDRAVAELSAALAEPAGATPVDIARARAMLARLYGLQGFRQAIEATRKRQEAWGLLRRLEDAAIAMGDHGKRIANCDALLSVEDKTLGAMASRAKADTEAAQQKIAQYKKQVQALEAQKASLVAANEKLLVAARKLRVDSQLADVLKSVELFDQAKVKEDKATENSVKVGEIEDSIQFLSSQTVTAALDVAAAGKRTAATTQMASAREQRKVDLRKKREGFVQRLSDSQKEVETLAGKVIGVWKGASAIEKKTAAAYRRAGEEYGEYDQSTVKGPARTGGLPPAEPVIIALSGDLRMARADLRVRSLALQARIGRVVASVTKAWSHLPVQKVVPAIVGQVAGYLPDAAKTKKDAQEDFRWAAKDYERALKQVSKKLQWAYRIQLAAAYTGLYRLSGDSHAREQASAALDELGEEKASRYVGPHAAHFRKLLAAGGAPSSAPAAP